ncbi:MAG: S-methyl-5-thioribose-1-phosphate isomerase [Thermoguttaceae bacterium]|nr:S-methyl-5-thioribose-1-phosphate isomerase [Thermoguttaceae bacterium]MDW8037539.1 S-methyl-5-thioribose-1-phosphate isomerase [Thermoguttaceae bacterium]
MATAIQHVETVRWCGGADGYLELVDQSLLPGEFRYLACRDLETLCEAIRQLRVRGAPAIGIAAAYGVVLGMQPALLGRLSIAGSTATAEPSNSIQDLVISQGPLSSDGWKATAQHSTSQQKPTEPDAIAQRFALEPDESLPDMANTKPEQAFWNRLERVMQALASTRPTAVNLFWALERMRQRALALRNQAPAVIIETLLQEAKAIHEEDRQMCRAIGRHGQQLLRDGQSVLTHCNAGGLATADYGTALAVIYAAVETGKRIHVYVDETRPLWQGARLTAWELQQRGIPTTLLCDNAAASLMQQGRIHAVITGADRIAANGDVANKIGTYGLAVLAAAHDIPFYVAAPSSSFDLAIADGSQIPIEHRPGQEVTHPLGQPIAPEGVEVYNPAFDVTPARLIRAIICERGIIQPVCREQITARLGNP